MQPGYNTIRFLVSDSKKKRIADVTKSYLNKNGGVIPLMDLKYESHSQGWGSFHANKSIDGNAMTINNQVFESGFGTHAPSTTTYNVEGKYKTFRTTVGLDDESLCGEGVYIEIQGDGETLATSPLILNGNPFTLSARIEGVQRLTLKSILKGGIDCSHVDFVNAVLIP